jgi:hypothetical protein
MYVRSYKTQLNQCVCTVVIESFHKQCTNISQNRIDRLIIGSNKERERERRRVYSIASIKYILRQIRYFTFSSVD